MSQEIFSRRAPKLTAWWPDFSFSGRSVSRCTRRRSRQPMEFLQLIDIRAGLSFPFIKTSVLIRRAAAPLGRRVAVAVLRDPLAEALRIIRAVRPGRLN